MALLRARFKFNPGRHGAPLDRLGEFTAQAEKFLRSMAADVGLSPKKGDWLATNFTNNSVEFNAEYAKALSDELAQKGRMAIATVASDVPMEAYNTGLVSVGTLAEFSKLSKSMQQDEIFKVGVLYEEEETEPAKWIDVPYTRLTEIKRILELPLVTYGSVQGTIEVWHFASSEGPFFVLREVGTNSRVHCNMAQALDPSFIAPPREKTPLSMLTAA